MTARASPSPLLNGTGTDAGTEHAPSAEAGWRALLLFGASLALGAVVCAGGLYSLASVPRMRTRTRSPLCLIVACLSVDDLVGVVTLALAAVLQWRMRAGAHGEGEDGDAAVCTWAGLLYVFHGLASNMKACLIAAYTLHASKRRRGARAAGESGGGGGVPCALAAVWAASLVVSALPLGGWGRFSRASLGCLPARDGFYVPLLVALYALCACVMAACSAPLTHQLLCSADALRRWEGAGGGAPSAEGEGAAAPLCEVQSVSRESLDRSYGELGSGTVGWSECGAEACPCSVSQGVRHCPVVFAQKRFSMILAMVRIVLWMPMMAQILVSHAIQMHSSSLETLCFFLTLLSAAVTPVFVLSERWIHLPCGCFINCRRGSTSISSTTNKRRFEFNLSFQQGYAVYKIPHVTSPSVEKPSYNSLYNCDFSESRIAVLDSGQIASLSVRHLGSPEEAEDISLHSELLLEAVSSEGRGEGLPQLSSGERGGFGSVSPPVSACDGEDLNLDSSSVFDGPERRLSHEECRKIELTDWEWCRSKSERTPRQRSAGAGGLAIPLCAFQGTVSLHAPTGKTLSLSTYEVSSDGLKISPNNAKKVEVYRSKSVGHEPSAEEPNSGGSSGGGGPPVPGGVADTNVKIHLEVLEICDNEEAMDSVSIVSNISQSSTHARSPSLRYSRRENRFVSCDLGETASYSLLIPTNPDADSINIHIPDTVEAHRQNSRRQRQDAGGYREEIQLLNEVYRRQGGDLGD
uniref:G protein-coupled receptor 149 n=1 Tax=Astyanax mexicanus TaxID=7994 RepID=A0A3B1JVS8_ASTMX